MPGTASARGFTLVELLLAMAISAFVALAGYQGLRVAIDAARAVETQSRRLADIQLALGILEDDISQMIARPVRNELGSLEPVVAGGLSADSLLLFTRDGWRNPRNLRRSELARINYRWNGDALVRQRWLVLDRADLETGLEEAVLLDGLAAVRVAFFSPFSAAEEVEEGEAAYSSGHWVDWWESERFGLEVEEPLPSAVRVTMTINGFGEVSRVITIPSA